MSQNGGVPDRIDGLSVDAAVDEIVASTDAQDPEAVRSVLDHVTEGNVVTANSFDEAVSEVSEVVSTAETRTELAEVAFEDAASTAEPVADVDAATARLDEFESELETVSARAAALTDDLQAAIGRPYDPESLYEIVSDLRDVASTAQSVQTEAEHLQVALGDFERWVDDPGLRVQELDGDVDAVARSVDTLTDAVDRLESAVDSDSPPDDIDPALAWFDTAIRHRTTALLLADVRAELADVEALSEQQDADADDIDEVAARLDEVTARHESVGESLDALERPAWREAYGERLADFEDALDDFEPPVSWGAVQETLADYRPSTGGV